MRRHDESRRAFLVGAAVGAVATTSLVPDAIAQTREQHGSGDAAAAEAPAQAHAHGAGHGTFFNDDDAVAVAAFAERLMPGAPGQDSPNYI
jgi:hypothetical protein